MVKRFQYPGEASIDPTTLDVGLRDEIQWFREFDIPIFRVLSIANIPSFFIDPETLGEFIELTTNEFQPLSELVILKHIQQIESNIIDPETFGEVLRDEIQWWQEFSTPILLKARVQEAGMIPIDLTVIEAPVEPDISFAAMAHNVTVYNRRHVLSY